MSDFIRCDRCGQTFASSSTFFHQCPACLFASALPDNAEGAGTSGRFQPAQLSQLQPLFPQLEIQELCGFGGMSAVYRAVQKNLGRTVALKILPQEVATSQGGLERFQREAKTLALLNHPNIVQVFDAGQTGEWCYILMEYIDGPNLRQFMGEHEIPPADVLRIVSAVCDGLKYAHDSGVVHRDIKPENILIDNGGNVKLVDFGMAKFYAAGLSEPTISVAGQIVGTPHYMAPEQFETPSTVDHRADIYSLGVMLYEMLTGELPIGSVAKPSIPANIKPELDSVVLRAMSRDRSKRFPTIQSFREELQSSYQRPKAVRQTVGSTRAPGTLRKIFEELALSIGSILAAVFGVIAVLMGFVVGVDWEKSRTIIDPDTLIRSGQPVAPPYVFYVLGLIAIPLAFLFARINVASATMWKEIRWTQFLSLPALIFGYLIFASLLLMGPGLAVILFGLLPYIAKVDDSKFADLTRSNFFQIDWSSPYWLSIYGTTLVTSSIWYILLGLVLLRHPGIVRAIFHPTTESSATTLTRIAAIVAIGFVLPIGVVLLCAANLST